MAYKRRRYCNLLFGIDQILSLYLLPTFSSPHFTSVNMKLYYSIQIEHNKLITHYCLIKKKSKAIFCGDFISLFLFQNIVWGKCKVRNHLVFISCCIAQKYSILQYHSLNKIATSLS